MAPFGIILPDYKPQLVVNHKTITMEQNRNRGSQQDSQRIEKTQKDQSQHVSSDQQRTDRSGSSRSDLNTNQDLGTQRSDRSKQSPQRSNAGTEESDYGSV